MTDLHASFLRLSWALVMTVCLSFGLPGRSLEAATGGMLSARDASGSVQDALIASPDSTASDMKEPSGLRGKRLPPGRVALISAVLPGYGQIYNHAAWKLPIYYGLMGYFVANAVNYNGKYIDYRNEYRLDPNAPGAAAAAVNRDDYRKRRNTQVVWLCLSYVAGILDAYVDAQLFDFDRIIDEKVGATAPQGPAAPLFSVSMKF
jgi:hypothetical protein